MAVWSALLVYDELTTSINSLYHTAKASLGSMYIVKRRADKISKECILVKMFKRSKGNLCMSFGFWFWQFDRSGAADRVMVTNT